MTRLKRGAIARKRRKKLSSFALGFRGAHNKLTKTINEQIIRAFGSSTRDRKTKKREFRHLWITRINAVIRQSGVSYSKLIHNLYKKQLVLNRKIFAQLAISNRPALYMISNEIF